MGTGEETARCRSPQALTHSSLRAGAGLAPRAVPQVRRAGPGPAGGARGLSLRTSDSAEVSRTQDPEETRLGARGDWGEMEQTRDLGLGDSELGDSALHRYLDCEFRRLKNQLLGLLGGCPLFPPRYRDRACPLSPRPRPCPLGPSASRRGRRMACAEPEMDLLPRRAGVAHRRPQQTVRVFLGAPSCLQSRGDGWPRGCRRVQLRVVLGVPVLRLNFG